MPPKSQKFRNVRRKKRSFCGNRYSEEKAASNVSGSSMNFEDESLMGQQEGDQNLGPSVKSPDLYQTPTNLPVSFRKLLPEYEAEDEIEDPAVLQGNRIIDMTILTNIIAMLLCPVGKKKNVIIRECSKTGFASEMMIICPAEGCQF